MTTTITNRQLIALNNALVKFIDSNIPPKTEESKKTEPTKFLTAAKNLYRKQVVLLVTNYNDKIGDMRDLSAATHPVNKTILKDANGQHEFTPEGSVKFKKEIKKALEETIEIHQRIVPIEDIPTDLTDDEKEAFENILIPQQDGESAYASE